MRFICIFITAVLHAPIALADQHSSGPIHAIEAWSRALPPVSENGAAYVGLKNAGDAADWLVAASSPVAERVEVHAHYMEGGLMKMRKVDSLELAPGESVILAPGGYHLMLFGLKNPLRAGAQFPLTLRFEHAPPIEVTVKVRGLSSGAAKQAPHGAHAQHSDHRPG